jgi:phosphopantothenoylcysteine decarboxylase/phosphopantothenate--cysteine ligase
MGIMSAAIQGKHILISAGPMRTAMDPVRYIQNRSSGKMGLALARACRDSGAARVTVLLGPVSEEMARSYSEFSVQRFEGPTDYEESLDRLFPDCDVFFSAAAVLDFEVIASEKKLERSQLAQLAALDMKIRAVPDIIAKFGAQKKSHQKVIAFAAESGAEAEILARADSKMLKKSADGMIANPLWPGLGPDSDQNLVWVLKPGAAPVKLGPDSKERLALPILQILF